MITLTNSKLTGVALAVALATLVSPVWAYPPDNAAVLYYKAFALYEVEDEIKSSLHDYRQGRIELNKEIEEHLIKNRRVVDIVLDATPVEHCDWGLDYSQGTEVLLPPHHEFRDICFLMAAEATLLADRGRYRDALECCLGMYRMARHLNERPLICYIVGVAINAVGHKSMTQVLGEMPADVELLTWLQAELTELDKQPYSIKTALRWKREAGQISMSPEKIGTAVQAGLDDGDFKTKIRERIRTADGPFYARNIAYWNDFMDRIEAAFDMPYAKAYAELTKLDKKPGEDFDKNPDATLTGCFAPTFLRIYVLALRLDGQSKALRAAIAVYLSHAKTGRLPETLPAGLPRDPFSGEPFAYERTVEGFVLRCQGKDLDKDEAYEYEFKVKG
ncbi:MAG: hypothetical protein ACYTAS_01030 [Planctomycetota bacterium]|jgi:hypothetical protein